MRSCCYKLSEEIRCYAVARASLHHSRSPALVEGRGISTTKDWLRIKHVRGLVSTHIIKAIQLKIFKHSHDGLRLWIAWAISYELILPRLSNGGAHGWMLTHQHRIDSITWYWTTSLLALYDDQHGSTRDKSRWGTGRHAVWE